MMNNTITDFKQLGLDQKLLACLTQLGYETPTAVQAEAIPLLLEGSDVLAQAQTGTGKTAAFALPILSKLDITITSPQALVIAPTRELAIQVSEAFQRYATHLPGFHVTPIYGGQRYDIQLKALKRGSHVVVGTPGRIMDHLRRGTLTTTTLKTMVLDEADEMLKMGFLEDIEWILTQIKGEYQAALFSATIPEPIHRIVKRYFKNANKIAIKQQATLNTAIEQFYMCVSNKQKLEALTRYLEMEDLQATIIFTRTKNTSNELAEKLLARGYAVAALNGDMNQSIREKVISQLKSGKLDIVVATDVAARGIDVSRVSHVINYDIPHDTESYIHRIGRTGRAGRQGRALLFVSPREQRLLNDIERAAKVTITQLEPPSLQQMNKKRNKQLTEKVIEVLTNTKSLEQQLDVIDSIREQTDADIDKIAAALLRIIQQAKPLPSHDIESAAAEPEATRPMKKRTKKHYDKPRFDRPKDGPKKTGRHHKKKPQKKHSKSK